MCNITCVMYLPHGKKNHRKGSLDETSPSCDFIGMTLEDYFFSIVSGGHTPQLSAAMRL